MSKRFVACVVLSLVMCLAMAFPVSAANNTSLLIGFYISDYSNCTIDGLSNYQSSLIHPISYISTSFGALTSGLVSRYSSVTNSSLVSSKIPSQYRSYKFVSTSDSVVSNINNGFLNVLYTNKSVISPGSIYYRAFINPSNEVNVFGPYVFRGITANTTTSVTIGHVDISLFMSLLETAKSKVNVGYTETSWQFLKEAISVSEGLLNTLSTTVPTSMASLITSAENDLQKAIDGLQLLPDTSALQALINTAKSKTNTGYTNTSWQALQSAITNAENFLKTSDYTKAQVDSEKNKLQAALDGLELLPDTMELEELLVEADQIEDIGYTVPTWTRFDNARIAGHTLIARPTYTEQEVTATTTELRLSMDNLELMPDISELTALLAEADRISDTGYTSASWSRFSNARSSGHALLTRADYTQSEVAAAVTELMRAMSGLTLAPVDPPVTPPSTGDYLPTDFNAFFGSERADTYLDIVGGFSVEHLFPAIEGIKENIGEARNFGIWVFIAIVAVLLTTRILRSMVGIERIDATGSHETVFNLGMTDEKRSAFASKSDMSRKERVLWGSEYRGTHLSEAKKGEKYIDW